MPATGARARTFRDLLIAAGATPAVGTLPRPTTASIAGAGLADLVDGVYRSLGGQQSEARIQLGNWDIETDGIAVELDEDLHFNRYRRRTLESPLYEQVSFPRELYRRLCEEREGDCLRAGRWGGRWAQPRAALEFGAAGNQGQLDGSGSPRWKQRAFYDFVKDTAPLTVGVSVARISVWEEVQVAGKSYAVGALLQQVVSAPLEDSATAVWQFVHNRASRPVR